MDKNIEQITYCKCNSLSFPPKTVLYRNAAKAGYTATCTHFWKKKLMFSYFSQKKNKRCHISCRMTHCNQNDIFQAQNDVFASELYTNSAYVLCISVKNLTTHWSKYVWKRKMKIKHLRKLQNRIKIIFKPTNFQIYWIHCCLSSTWKLELSLPINFSKYETVGPDLTPYKWASPRVCGGWRSLLYWKQVKHKNKSTLSWNTLNAGVPGGLQGGRQDVCRNLDVKTF